MHELLPGIFVWSRFSDLHGYDFNGTFVRHPDGNLCIDPVEPGADVLERLIADGVAEVLLTNRNHLRSANLVRQRTGAPVRIHAADAAYARGQGGEIDGELRAGDRVGPFTVVGVPGKSPGEVALHWAPRRVLVVGDVVIGNPPGAVSLLREKVMDDPDLLRASARALLALDFDALVVGDGVSILDGARQRLRALVATFPARSGKDAAS